MAVPKSIRIYVLKLILRCNTFIQLVLWCKTFIHNKTRNMLVLRCITFIQNKNINYVSFRVHNIHTKLNKKYVYDNVTTWHGMWYLGVFESFWTLCLLVPLTYVHANTTYIIWYSRFSLIFFYCIPTVVVWQVWLCLL